jgi:cell division protein FtsL
LTRFLNFFLIAVLATAAIGVYSIKYEATRQAERVSKLQRAIERERIAIGALRAEMARLARPERVADLASRHLDLRPMAIDQMIKAQDLPEKPVEQDEIARKLEGLGQKDIVTGSTP